MDQSHRADRTEARSGPLKRAQPDDVEPLSLASRLIRQIRTSPTKPLSLFEVSQAVGMSPVRLHQVFKRATGENFGAFVRRARLEYACELMRARPDWNCTRIGQEAGFSESSAFSRTFRRTFGLPPSRWDRITPLNASPR